MEDLFELVMEKGGEPEIQIRIGIRMKVAGFETTCPVTRPCKSYDALEREIQGIRHGLDALLGRAKKVFQSSAGLPGFSFNPQGPAEEIWVALSGMNEEPFMETFNGLEEGKRREVAEYVLAHCNVFSGKGLVFSERYDEGSALMG